MSKAVIGGAKGKKSVHCKSPISAVARNPNSDWTQMSPREGSCKSMEGQWEVGVKRILLRAATTTPLSGTQEQIFPRGGQRANRHHVMNHLVQGFYPHQLHLHATKLLPTTFRSLNIVVRLLPPGFRKPANCGEMVTHSILHHVCIRSSRVSKNRAGTVLSNIRLTYARPVCGLC